MRFKTILLSVLFFVRFVFSAFSTDTPLSKQVSEAKIKAALVINFAQNIQWANESAISVYKIGVMDQDSSVYNELLAVRNTQKIKEKSFSIDYLNQQSNYSNYNILYFGEKTGRTLSNIYREINRKGVLVITDRSVDRVLTMINIIFNKDKKTFSFEINKENLDANGFIVNSKILLLGGSYVDIKELYLQTSELLHKETERINQYKAELDRISKEKEEYQSEINELNKKIGNLASSIKQSEEEYAQLTGKLKGRDSLLSMRTLELQKKVEESRALQSLIKSQLNSIKNASSKLDSLDSEIDVKQRALDTKQTQIERQNKQINQQDLVIIYQQRRFLVVMLIVLGLLLGLFFAYWAYRMKLNLNQKLERLVDERTFELQKSREYYANLFENSPIAMFELDLSALNSFVEKIDYINKLPNIKSQEALKLISEGLSLIKVINTNQSGIELFGFKSKAEAEKHYIKTYNADFSPESFKNVLFAMVEKKSSCAYEGVRQTINGDILYVHLKWMVLPGYEENYEKVLLTVSDITKLKNYQKELNRHKDHLEDIVFERTNEIIKLNQELTSTNAELQKKTEELSQIIQMLESTQDQLIQSEKMASLGMLTAGIAHEINNPVNFISGSYQALQTQIDEMWNLLNEFRDGVSSPNSSSILSEIEAKHKITVNDLFQSMKFLLMNIETGITRTTEIIRSLMTFSRNESQEFSVFDIKTGVRDVLVILKSRYSGKIDIIEDYDSNLPEIVCNSNGISQVLMNLISNAIDSIHDRGKIKITAKYKPTTDEVLIRITDSGVGIPEEIIDKIFDPFFTTKEVGKGTGLGLYISYNMVKAHQGTIDVDSTLGKGTTFTVCLPKNAKK
ncbi:hypothetical protein CYCD_10260 [Tenuifilaceae bacterium CYCD]|nr:hypothetical protein CYCD_10260 [Tenuifilaceae bacterium CYCD]